MGCVQGGFALRGAADQLLTWDEDEGQGDEVEVLVAGGGGRVRRAVLPLLPPDASPFAEFERRYRAAWVPRSIRAEWRNGAALLVYQTCQDRSSPGFTDWASAAGVAPEDVPSMAATCADLFPEMRRRGTRHLVLDLRSNGGGSDHVTAPLWRHLFDGEVRGPGEERRVSPTARASYETFGERPLGDTRIPPRVWRCAGAPDRFEGPVTALTDPGT